jgi:leucyl aminopeptidase
MLHTDTLPFRLGPVPDGGHHVRLVLVTRDELDRSVDPRLARRADFSGSVGEVWVLPDFTLVGLGPPDEVNPETVVRAFSAVASAITGADAVAVEVPSTVRDRIGEDELAYLAGSGLAFGSRYLDFEALVILSFPGQSEDAFRAGLLAGAARARVAELVDRPPNQLTPTAFAEQVREWATQAGVACEIFCADRLAELGAGGLLAIGSGSVNPPALVHLTSGPTDVPPDLVVVGKGITFDSGGLSIKPSDAMPAMKSDMAGAGVAVETALHAARSYPHLRVDAVCAMAENLPGGSACRPGDVVRTISGRTIEILDTDFEGRVVLADALGYAMTLEPKRVIDVATLTVASMYALGTQIGALFASDEDLATQLTEAATTAGEALWRLPLDRRYDDQLTSDLADVRNFPGHPYGRAITAARFLSRFIDDDVAWAHLDIAGPAWSWPATGCRGGTGFGVTTLARLLHELAHTHSHKPIEKPIEKVVTP